MSFTASDIKAVRDLAQEMVYLCDVAMDVLSGPEAGRCLYYDSPKLSGQVRRRSMDLTRALAEMRKP